MPVHQERYEKFAIIFCAFGFPEVSALCLCKPVYHVSLTFSFSILSYTVFNSIFISLAFHRPSTPHHAQLDHTQHQYPQIPSFPHTYPQNPNSNPQPWATPRTTQLTHIFPRKKSHRNPTSPSSPPPHHPSGQWISPSTAATAAPLCQKARQSPVLSVVRIASRRRMARRLGFTIRNYRRGWVEKGGGGKRKWWWVVYRELEKDVVHTWAGLCHRR